MDGGDGVFSKEEVQILGHMVDSMNDAGKSLRESYEKRDYERFNKIKKLMIGLQRKISEVLA